MCAQIEQTLHENVSLREDTLKSELTAWLKF